MSDRGRGRPIGFKLSEASKRAISEAKKGQKHKESTKVKISRTLREYFRSKNPLSDEIINTYCRVNDDSICDWMYNVTDELDSYRDILTQRILKNKLNIELSYGDNIEKMFSHSITPELLIMYKEERLSLNIELDDEEDYEGEIR